MNNKYVVLSYIIIALVTFVAMLVAYFFIPKRTVSMPLTALADSVNTRNNRFATNRYYKDTTLSWPKYPSPKKFLNLELNSADSAALVRAKGIGPTFASRIIAYRRRLGGYANVEQLKEVKGIDDERFTKISRNFYVDTAHIQKININFATLNDLTRHPYITLNLARRLLEARKSKGGYVNYQQLIQHNIITPREARKVASYLAF